MQEEEAGEKQSEERFDGALFIVVSIYIYTLRYFCELS